MLTHAWLYMYVRHLLPMRIFDNLINDANHDIVSNLRSFCCREERRIIGIVFTFAIYLGIEIGNRRLDVFG